MLNLPIYARNLKFLRQIRGDTQKDIADLLGKGDKGSIGQIETGRNGMSVVDMMKLCDYFKISETNFCRGFLWLMTDGEIEKLKKKWEGKEENVLHGINL